MRRLDLRHSEIAVVGVADGAAHRLVDGDRERGERAELEVGLSEIARRRLVVLVRRVGVLQLVEDLEDVPGARDRGDLDLAVGEREDAGLGVDDD